MNDTYCFYTKWAIKWHTRRLYARCYFLSIGMEKCTVCVLFSVHGTNIRCFRHLFPLNKWQYRDEYIFVIVVLPEKNWKKLRLKNCKKWYEWYSNPRLPATMLGMLTTEPLGHMVTAADQAYLIITDVLIYCTVVVTMSRDVDGK